jgi:FtsH-binding integral membrane protein
MSTPQATMKSIWFFVGLMLLIVGSLVCLAGIIDFVSPPERKTVLAGTHPAIWWSLLMIVSGGLFLFTHRNKRHDV